MNESVLVVIFLIVTLIPCLIAFLLVRFIPGLRYLPSGLLLVAGLCFLLSALGTKPTGGGISGFGDLPIFVEMIIGAVFVIASGVIFVVSFLMYKWLGSRHAE